MGKYYLIYNDVIVLINSFDQCNKLTNNGMS